MSGITCTRPDATHVAGLFIGDLSPGGNTIQVDGNRFDAVAHPSLATKFTAKTDLELSHCYVPFLDKFLIAGNGGQVYLYDGTNYESKVSNLPSDKVWRFAASDEVIIACASDNAFYSSVDGENFTPLSFSFARFPTYIKWVNGSFFLSNSSNGKFHIIQNDLTVVSYDKDGDITSFDYDVEWIDGKYVIVCDGGKIYTAEDTDLTDWTLTEYGEGEGTDQNLKCIANFNGLLIAGGANGAMITATDPTGIWTPQTSNTAGTVTSLTFSDSIVVAGVTTDIISSEDGIDWAAASGSDPVQNVIYGATPDIFFGMTWAGTDPQYIIKSADGETLEQIEESLVYYKLPSNPWEGETNLWIATS